MKLHEFLKKEYGFDCDVKDRWERYVNLWKSWYIGKVKQFHNYYIYNGKRRVRMSRASMQMAKKCCEDWADLLFNERCKISLADENSLEQLDEVLGYNNFWKFMNEAIEKAGACGTGAVVVSVHNMEYDEMAETLSVANSNTCIEFVDIEKIYPLSWKGKRITECAFASHEIIRGRKYLFLSVHRRNEQGNYIIENKVFDDRNGSITPVDNDDIISSFDTGSNRPWFAIISPQQANNICPDLPWGIPFFANAIDTLQALDLSFDCLQFEMSASKRRTFVRQEAINVDLKTGEIAETFDPNDVAFYVLPAGMNREDLVQTESSEIRSAAICETISKNLALFSSQVGLGFDKYKFDPVSMATATQVISQNSEMYRRKKKHETGLEDAIYDIIEAVAYAASTFGPYNINTDGLAIQFDQSIVEDKEAISNRALRELSAGVLAKYEYRMLVHGEDEETARAKIEEIELAEPDVKSLLGVGE